MENGLQLKKEITELFGNTEDKSKFLTKLRWILQSFGDDKRKEQYKKYIPNIGENFGTPISVLTAISKNFGKWGEKNTKEALNLLKKMWGRTHEEKFIVCKSLERIGRKDFENTMDFIKSILIDIQTWDICDTLATSGLSELVISKPEEILLLSEKWVEDKNKWIRRFGIVSLIPFLRIAPNKYMIGEKELKIVEKLMTDEEIYVKKAVAWIIRQIGIKYQELIFNFLMKFTNTNNKHTKWIIRNGMKKLPSYYQNNILSLIK